MIRLNASLIKGWRDGCPLRTQINHEMRAYEGQVAASRFTARGTKTHADIERYYQTRKTTALDPWVTKALRHMPKPSEVLGIEAEIAAHPPVKNAGYFFGGTLDLIVDGPEFWDWKTTSNLKWAKTKGELQQDIQGNIYAYMLMLNAHIERTSGHWLYMQATEPYPTRCVSVDFHLDKVIEFLIKSVHPTCKKLVEYYAQTQEPSRNFADCSTYGGCDIKDMCRMAYEQKPPLFAGIRKAKNG